MTTKAIVHITVSIPTLILVPGDGICGGAVAHTTEHRTRALAHVLQDDIALEVGVAAAVLGSPLYRKLRSHVVLVCSHIDASTAVVLRIEQSVGVVAIAVGFVQPGTI